MASSSDGTYLPDNHCEICGAELTDEVVIQEFADGSIAHLCTECAAGAALQSDTAEFQFPDVPPMYDDESLNEYLTAEHLGLDEEPAPETSSSEPVPTPMEAAAPAAAAAAQPFQQPAASKAASADLDTMEKTRELLTPVVDLIGLQQEMQGALQRLATSLQTFATDVYTEQTDQTATVEGRLQALEQELERTRARLRETEALLAASAAATSTAAPAPAAPAATAAAAAAAVAASAAVPPPAIGPLPIPEPEVAAKAPVDEDTEAPAAAAEETASIWDFDETVETTDVDLEVLAAPGPDAEEPKPSDSATQPYSAEDLESALPPVAPLLVPPPVAPPAGPPTSDAHTRPAFQLPEVQLAQRYFNESQFTGRIRDVRKSLGRPKANLTRLLGTEPQALVTIFWDIIWYQYLVDLRRDLPSDARVTLHREGMDLDELTSVFTEKNASVDDDGRLDASELEVKLLSDPTTLITEMSPEDERALEDATEEIWDQRTAPEFKWDD